MEHSMSQLLTGMRKPPLIAGTNQYSTMHDSKTVPQESTMQEYYSEDTLKVDQSEPVGFSAVTEAEKEMRIVSFEDNRHTLTAEFYKKLQDLKNEHNKTLSMLNKLYLNSDNRCHTAQEKHRSKLKGKIAFVTEKVEDYDNDEDKVSLENFEGNVSNKEDTIAVKKLRNTYNNMEFNAEVELDKEPTSHIEEMWNDFKMKDYLSPNLVKLRKEMKKERPKSAPTKKSWSPVITIPKPFSMTLREEQKKEKTHTRSSKEVAEEWRLKKAKEEEELAKKWRAQEPPAHTFLPLYEEIVERQKERSRLNKENAASSLRSIVSPFSFTEKDEAKLKNAKIEEALRKRKELRKIKKTCKFVAQPVPSSVHDPTVSEKLQENELYRHIKIKLRSEDTMRASALPPRMHAHQMMTLERQKERQRRERKNQFSFRPTTTEVPDFKTLHKREMQEIAARKVENMNTITEPFNLRTLSRGEQKRAMKEAMESIRQEEEDFQTSLDELNRKIKITQYGDPLPQKMTESARLRIMKTRQELEKAEQDLIKLKEQEKQRKIRYKQMSKEVHTRTSLGFDNGESRPKPGGKVKQYQKQTALRDKEYANQLREIHDRVNKRPFLFEQQAQTSARAQVDKRYKEILRNSGLSDDEFGDFDANEYSFNRQSTPLVRDNYSSDSGEDINEVIVTQESKDYETPNEEVVKKKLEFDLA